MSKERKSKKYEEENEDLLSTFERIKLGSRRRDYGKIDISTDLYEFIDLLPCPSPTILESKIRCEGYKGQDHALKAMCLIAYRHIRRLKNIYINGIDENKISPSPRVLLIGPTGCGKTFLVELLFRNLLGLPTAIIDITGFSETGYVGEDVSTLLTRLLYAADFDVSKASVGIIFIDEFDKLASAKSNARFDGQGTTKDVSGFGVQRELLKIFGYSDILVPEDPVNNYYSRKVSMSTRNISIFAAGAFSGLKGAIAYRNRNFVGFGEDKKSVHREQIAVNYDEEELIDTENFQLYGFLPELMGRINRVIIFEPLSRDILFQILTENVLKKYKLEFEMERIELKIRDEVLEKVIEGSLKKQTGARGLDGFLIKYFEDAAFHAFGLNRYSSLELFLKDNKIQWELK